MGAQEVKARVESFPEWHYDFDLYGLHTKPAKADWQDARARYFIDPIVRHYGGSLRGKRVVDLGCNAGYFSLKAIEAGCDFVLGVDGRQMHIDQANLVFEVNDIDPSRYRFACGNVLDFDYDEFAPFDLVLCLGLLYHLNKPIEFFEKISRINTDLLVIDTKLTPARGSWIELRRDSLETLLDAVDYDLVMVPTAKAVITMAELFGYQSRILAVDAADKQFLRKYCDGVFKAFVCSKSDLSATNAFTFQPMKSLYNEQQLQLSAKKPKAAALWSLRERLRRSRAAGLLRVAKRAATGRAAR
jgi:tRNA (mo5U34)-methyltransferase